MAEAEFIQRVGPRDITEDNLISLTPRLSYCINVGFDRDIGLAMRCAAYRRPICPTRPKPMMTVRGSVDLVLFVHFVVAFAQFDPARHVMANARQYRRDGQANGRCDLPEIDGLRVDDLRRPCRAQHNQRGFRRASHQHAGFSRSTGACAIQLEQSRRSPRAFTDHDSGDRANQRRPVCRDKPQINLHADADQEHTRAPAL